ncbi:hypothetical protein AAC387_Pa04g1383 [Persea americana]
MAESVTGDRDPSILRIVRILIFDSCRAAGWCCHRTLRCSWLCRQSRCRHRAEDGWHSEQSCRAAGWCCHRTLRCSWLRRQSWCRHRAEDELPSRGVVLSPDPEEAYACVAKAGAGTELRTVGTLNRAAEPRGGAFTGRWDAHGCVAKAGAGTELRTVGTLNRAAEPRGGAVTEP